MKIFITGATGYIGGSIADRLIRGGHVVSGLVRTRAKAERVAERDIIRVLGTLEDGAVLMKAAHAADAVINAASSDHRMGVEFLVDALSQSEKPLIHTSGTSIICDDARGEYESAKTFYDDSFIKPLSTRIARVEIDRFVRRAGVDRGIRAIVICPSMIYRLGRGLQVDSDQVPKLREQSRKRGTGLYIGKGLNRWSNVHSDDLVDLYLLALERAPSGSFFFTENGEDSLLRVAEAVSHSLGFGGRASSWDADEAIAEYGDWAKFALASNSRVRATNARRLLGWQPHGPNLIETLEGERI